MKPSDSVKRRSFLNAMNGAVPVTALALGGATLATAKPSPSRWTPARHDKDDWLDKNQAKHRLVIDTTTAAEFGEGLLYASNFVTVNKNEYALQPSDLAVVVVARHFSTPFGYNDAMWAKYGATLYNLIKFEDPKTKQPPTLNVFAAADRGDMLSSLGVTVDAVNKEGVQFGVCGMATSFFSGLIAKAVNGDAAKVNAEIAANLIPNARIVPAGISAVSRAQERGYTFVKA